MASGQAINLAKSDIMFSAGIREQRRQLLANTLGVRCVEHHNVYLGILIARGRSRSAMFRGLVEGV